MCGVGVDVTERKRTEEVLRSRESLLNNVLHSTADGILVIGDQGEVLIANRRFQELWQLPDALMAKGRDADLLAHVVHQLADPDDFLAEVHRLYQTDEEHWSQIAFEDGRVFERYSRPVPLAGHRARLWSFRDVTAGKRAERLQRAVSLISNAALTTSNLDELFRSIHDTIGELMPARNFFIALREPTTGLIRFPYYTDEHDQDASPIPPGRGLTGYVLRTGKPLLATRERYEELVGCGEVDRIGAPPVAWLGVPLKTQHGETIGVMAVQTYTETIRLGAADRDMLEFVSTQVAMAIERKRSEEFLRRSQTDLERAQAAGHVGSWISSLQPGGPLSWSTETLRIFGIPEGEFDGRGETFFRLVHPEDLAAVRAASEAARRGDRLYDLEHRIVRPDGAIRWVHERAEVERDALGRPVRMVGVVQDITERRHLEERLRQAQKMEAVGQLAGGVAHDFNNILTATLLQLNLLQENPNLDLEAREALRELERGAQRAADLTRQLLLFGRRSAMQFQPLDLNDLLTDLQKMLRRLLGEHILLEFVSESGLPRISADASMIQQVVVNLCVNARDAMPAGGRLSVRTAGVDLDADQVQDRPGARPGLFVCLSVADTGAGMDDATLQHIFEPFFTTKEVGKGTGLGLATVHGIIQQHEGWLEVQSAVDQGTTFRVFLPAYVAPAATASAVVPQPEVVGGHETVLLVEDDAAVRTMIAMFLRRWGYKVLEATTGQEAMSLWQQEGATIDLLYTDVVMPGGLSGTQLTEQLRAQKPNLKVILSSGYSADLAQKDPGLAPNVVFVPKPCSAADLALTVRRCLDRTPH
jgi:PAS domain S-box-containing protein